MPMAMLAEEAFHYTLAGPAGAPVLVFSNSLGTALSLWEPQAAALSRTHRVLCYDARGHGASLKTPGPYTIEQVSRDVLNLADALGIESFSFCGISMGGLVGQWLGAYAPGRVERLVLCNTAARIGSAEAWRERAALVRSQGMGPVAQGTPGRWFTPGFIERQPALAAQWAAAVAGTDAEGYAASCDALAVADLHEVLERIQAPTLVIAGKHDPVTTVEHADELARRIPKASRCDLDASHLSNIEAPEDFTRAVAGHLGR